MAERGCTPSAFEEVVANHARQVDKAASDLRQLNRNRRHLGLQELQARGDGFDYRSYLAERFDIQLGISGLSWPSVPHSSLVARAVNRVPPFDQKANGYRGSLIWENVLELARRGDEITLVTADGIFAGPDGALTPDLASEIAPLQGTVELVRDFGPWLLEHLPWNANSLESAVAQSHNDEFYHYFLHSDFVENLTPAVQDLGFRWSPYACEIIESRWGGTFTPLDSRTGTDGYTLVEYEIDEVVTFQAEFPEGFEPEPGWLVSEPDLLRRVQVTGEIEMVVRIAVLFGAEFGFTVDKLSWRTKGNRQGCASVVGCATDPHQLSLIDPHGEGDLKPEYTNVRAANLERLGGTANITPQVKAVGQMHRGGLDSSIGVMYRGHVRSGNGVRKRPQNGTNRPGAAPHAARPLHALRVRVSLETHKLRISSSTSKFAMVTTVAGQRDLLE